MARKGHSSAAAEVAFHILCIKRRVFSVKPNVLNAERRSMSAGSHTLPPALRFILLGEIGTLQTSTVVKKICGSQTKHLKMYGYQSSH